MRKLISPLVLSLFLISCGGSSTESKEVSSGSKPVNLKEVKKGANCSDDTVLAEGKGIKVTLADYRYTWKLLSPKSKEFFQNHPEELLKRMVNRRLVLAYVEDSGIAKKYGLDKEMEKFKKDYLARLFVSDEAQKRVRPITEEDIVKRFKELFPNKDPSKMSKGDKEFIRNELKVKFYDEAVKSIYSEVEKKIKLKREGDFVVASCCGIEVKEKAGKEPEKAEERAKERLITEYFYRKAVEAGYDKNPEFQRMYTEYFASKAIELFRKELARQIKVEPSEVKEYYEKNREKFKMPERVKAVVLYFSDKKRAEEAAEMLKEGKPWEEVARRFGQFNAKERVYYKDTKDPIGVALFSIANPKKKEPVIISLGENRYALLYPVEYVPEGEIPFEKAKKFVALKLKEKKLRQAEEEKLKELWKEYGVKLENLECLR